MEICGARVAVATIQTPSPPPPPQSEEGAANLPGYCVLQLLAVAKKVVSRQVAELPGLAFYEISCLKCWK